MRGWLGNPRDDRIMKLWHWYALLGIALAVAITVASAQNPQCLSPADEFTRGLCAEL